MAYACRKIRRSWNRSDSQTVTSMTCGDVTGMTCSDVKHHKQHGHTEIISHAVDCQVSAIMRKSIDESGDTPTGL
jgi:hypothetical protein